MVRRFRQVSLSCENQGKITLKHVVLWIEFDGAAQLLLSLGQSATLRSEPAYVEVRHTGRTHGERVATESFRIVTNLCLLPGQNTQSDCCTQ